MARGEEPVITALLVCLLWAAPEDRPSEEALFGEPASAPSSAPAIDRDSGVQGGAAARDAFQEGRAKDDPLKIGGRFSLRAYGEWAAEKKLREGRFSVPMLVDAYLDARPTDRLRAMVLGRLQYDPFLGTSPLGIPSAQPAPNPSVALAQAWLAFDLARVVFVTAGRQQVKWGTARVFNPTDFLSAQFRDPLAPFDARVGVTMLKLSVPWEATGWSFSGVALFEPTMRPAGGLGSAGASGTTSLTALPSSATAGGTAATGGQFGDIGGAARVEAAFGATQLGMSGLVQRGRTVRGGFDLTTALGPVDVYGEVAVRGGTDVPLYRLKSGVDPSIAPLMAGVTGAYETYSVKAAVGASGGLSYELALPNNRALSLGGEYFFNSTGYRDFRIYPWLIFNAAFQPFYNGQHYAALVVAFIDNGARVSAVLSNVGNLSDLSAVSRVDFSIAVLSFLRVEAFAAVHYGQRGGEFRFAFSQPAMTIGVESFPAIEIAAPLIDVGVGLVMSL